MNPQPLVSILINNYNYGHFMTRPLGAHWRRL